MRLGLVVPRYGTEVLGGTEHWLRLLCEHLVSSAAWDVEVFTTGAVSAATWADELPPGVSDVNGVLVHRHRSVSGRRHDYLRLAPVMATNPGVVPDDVAERYVTLVGPVCPGLVDAAERSSCDLVAVTPYLYWPALQAVRRLGRRVLFHAAAHDELELHLGIMGPAFSSVGGFAFNTHAERALVEEHFDVAGIPADVVGIAVLEQPGSEGAARRAIGLADGEPFVLCLGRVERSKGVHALAEMWRLYRTRRPDAPRLVVLGPVHEPLPGDAHVVVAGPQSEEVKWGALRQCTFAVSPSAWESFSIVVVEAMLASRPVVVNSRCEATMEHCRRSDGGLWFTEYADFEAVADRLLADDGLRARLGERGREYARREFAWSTVAGRYTALAERVLAARQRPAAISATPV